MKITPLPIALSLNERVHKKENASPDGDGNSQPQYQKDNQSEKKQDEEKEEKKLTFSPELNQILTNEVEKFKDDPAALTHGLNAQVQGTGPGLRVTLRDGYGAVVRQFTGEEFLKLRESAVQGVGRGKILDKKL